MILIILYLIGILISGEILYLMGKYYPTIYRFSYFGIVYFSDLFN